MALATWSRRRTRALLRVGAASAIVLAVGTSIVTTSAASAQSSGFSSPISIGNGDYTLGSLSCTGAGDCTSVGTIGRGADLAYDIESNGTWGPSIEIPDPDSNGVSEFLTSVSCTDPLDCTAIGEGASGQVAITESDGTWGPLTVIIPGGGYALGGVSCTGAGDCSAVGWDQNDLPDIVTQSDGVWSSPSELLPPPLTEATDNSGQAFTVSYSVGQFSDINCAATGCTAVGQVEYLGPQGTEEVAAYNVYATEVNGTWSPLTFSSVPSSSGSIISISCTGAGDCTALDGNYAIVTETNGTWGPITPSVGELNSVSCSDALDCTAVGEDNYEPAYAVETDGSWGPIIEDTVPINPAIGIVAGFEGVSCAGATACTASGFDGGTGWDSIVATTFDPGGAITLGRSSGLLGSYVDTVSGTGWNVHGDTSVDLYECAGTSSYVSSSCTGALATPGVDAAPPAKVGDVSKTPITLQVGTIGNSTCGLSTSPACYVVAVGSTGDTNDAPLTFNVPTATAKKTTGIVANSLDTIETANFPIGDSVTARECDASVTLSPDNTSTNCGGTPVSGMANGTGKATLALPMAVGTYSDGAGLPCDSGGTCNVVLTDTTNPTVTGLVIPVSFGPAPTTTTVASNANPATSGCVTFTATVTVGAAGGGIPAQGNVVFSGLPGNPSEPVAGGTAVDAQCGLTTGTARHPYTYHVTAEFTSTTVPLGQSPSKSAKLAQVIN